jgi:hypothetical protein
MSLAQSFIEPIREYFTLRRAEGTVRAYAPAQHALVAAHVEAARERLAAARRTAPPIPAAVLLRDAVAHSLRAAAVAADASAGVAHLDLAAAMPALPVDPARPRAEPTDDARVRAALASSDPLYFDRLSPEDGERARVALDRAAGFLRRRVEARSVTHLRGARWGRRGAVLLVLGWALFVLLRAKLVAPDVALGKPVHPSSRKPGSPDPKELVDGDLGTSYGVFTNVEDSPSVVIDLQWKYWVDTVKVHNRVDGWQVDDCLPLVVELSQDGTHWDEVGRRVEHFEGDPPWVVHAGGRPAHFVRVRVDRKSYLALSEVEVYGKKD